MVNSQTVLALKTQLRTRTELRDGYATLNAKDAKPAFFTSQRTRIGAGITHKNVELRMTYQGVMSSPLLQPIKVA